MATSPAKQAWKARNYEEAMDDIERLVAFDFRIVSYPGDYHFRINGRLDVWPTTKKWYDLNSKRRGTYKSLYIFARDFFTTASNGTR